MDKIQKGSARQVAQSSVDVVSDFLLFPVEDMLKGLSDMQAAFLYSEMADDQEMRINTMNTLFSLNRLLNGFIEVREKAS